MPANAAHLGMVVGGCGNGRCRRAYYRSAPTCSGNVPAWRLPAAGYLGGFIGAGHLRTADSILRLQSRLLPVPGGHAPHRPGLPLRTLEPRIGHRPEPLVDATVRRSRHRDVDISLVSKYADLSQLLELASSASRSR